MGAGLLLVPLSILIYLPVLIWSVYFYRKTTKAYKQDSDQPIPHFALRQLVALVFVVALLSNENFGDVVFDALQYSIDREWHWFVYWLKSDIKRLFLGWDDWYDITYFWISVVVAYVIGYLLAYATTRSRTSKLQQYNTKTFASVILVVQGLIVISVLGRLFGWEPMANEWLGI